MNDDWFASEHDSECRVGVQFALGVVALVAAILGVTILATRRHTRWH